MQYLLQTPRLGIRDWITEDHQPMAALNADPEVMRFFHTTYSFEETGDFIERCQKSFAERGYTYFAVDRLDTGVFIGFIGLAYQDWESGFTPAVDMGWRLAKEHWGRGFATEGAEACLQYAFEVLNLPEVIAIASAGNLPSIHVMKKIGLTQKGELQHPKLMGIDHLVDCVVYSQTNPALEP